MTIHESVAFQIDFREMTKYSVHQLADMGTLIDDVFYLDLDPNDTCFVDHTKCGVLKGCSFYLSLFSLKVAIARWTSKHLKSCYLGLTRHFPGSRAEIKTL